MAEQKDVAKRKVTLKNTTTAGQRFVFDVDGKQHLIGPGEQVEVELAEPQAKQLEEASKSGGGALQVEGFDPEEQGRLDEAPEVPEEQTSRTALAQAELALMQEGQEADKERREKAAKLSGPQLAAQTGIHMYARGLKPEVVASPPDAPAKKLEQGLRSSSSLSGSSAGSSASSPSGSRHSSRPPRSE